MLVQEVFNGTKGGGEIDLFKGNVGGDGEQDDERDGGVIDERDKEGEKVIGELKDSGKKSSKLHEDTEQESASFKERSDIG